MQPGHRLRCPGCVVCGGTNCKCKQQCSELIT